MPISEKKNYVWNYKFKPISNKFSFNILKSIIDLSIIDLHLNQAQNPDELSIIESEQLEVVGEGDGDGWLRARNYRGEEGYVPHNYLDVDREQVLINYSYHSWLMTA